MGRFRKNPEISLKKYNKFSKGHQENTLGKDPSLQ
jgi:hypothetical protein